MNATPLKILPVLFAFVLAAASVQGAYREFTDQQGRSMKAELINVIGSKVRIKRDDGATFNVTPNLFCEEDAEYIRIWMMTTLAERDSLLKINAKASGTKPQEVNMGTGIEAEKWSGYYKIDLENESDIDLSEIHLEYVYLAFHMELGADKRREGKTQIVKGDLTIPRIKGRGEFAFDSVKCDMLNTELASGYVWADGGKDQSKDKLEGIWIRVYYSGRLIQEWSYPTNMVEKYSWEKLTK